MAGFTAGPSRVAAAPLTAVRHKSGPYGYTQAKALVFSKTGEPGDFLKYVYLLALFLFILLVMRFPFCYSLASRLTRRNLSKGKRRRGGGWE